MIRTGLKKVFFWNTAIVTMSAMVKDVVDCFQIFCVMEMLLLTEMQW